MQPPRRGGRAVECGGLENRFGLLGPTRVQIPPPPLNQAGGRVVTRSSACHLAWAELSTRPDRSPEPAAILRPPGHLLGRHRRLVRRRWTYAGRLSEPFRVPRRRFWLVPSFQLRGLFL